MAKEVARRAAVQVAMCVRPRDAAVKLHVASRYRRAGCLHCNIFGAEEAILFLTDGRLIRDWCGHRSAAA